MSGDSLHRVWEAGEAHSERHGWTGVVFLPSAPSHFRVVASVPVTNELRGQPGGPVTVVSVYFNDALALRSTDDNSAGANLYSRLGAQFGSPNWATRHLREGENAIRVEIEIHRTPTGNPGTLSVTYGPPRVWLFEIDSDRDGVSDRFDRLPLVKNRLASTWITGAGAILLAVGFALGRKR